MPLMWPGIDAQWRNLANHTVLRWSRRSGRVLLCLCVHRARNTTLRQILPRLCHKCVVAHTRKVTAVGFEPTPFRNGALGHRLRPLGQSAIGSIKRRYISWHGIAPEGRAASATLCWPSGAAAVCCRIRGVARGMPALGVIGKPRGGPGPRQS